MYMVCGEDINDLLNGVVALLKAVNTGAACGVGGSTIEEMMKAVEMMKEM